MKRLIIVPLLAFIAWKGYGQFESNRSRQAPQGIADVSPQVESLYARASTTCFIFHTP